MAEYNIQYDENGSPEGTSDHEPEQVYSDDEMDSKAMAKKLIGIYPDKAKRIAERAGFLSPLDILDDPDQIDEPPAITLTEIAKGSDVSPTPINPTIKKETLIDAQALNIKPPGGENEIREAMETQRKALPTTEQQAAIAKVTGVSDAGATVDEAAIQAGHAKQIARQPATTGTAGGPGSTTGLDIDLQLEERRQRLGLTATTEATSPATE